MIKISMTYDDAVLRLLKFAESDSGASAPAATVLLSIETQGQWKFDLTDLSILDPDNFEAAICVMKYWHEQQVTPSSILVDGQEIFQELRKKWAHLRNDR